MAEQRTERRLAAILAGDVAGYSRLMGADEEDTLTRLNMHRREFLEPKVTKFSSYGAASTRRTVWLLFVMPMRPSRMAAMMLRHLRWQGSLSAFSNTIAPPLQTRSRLHNP